MVSKLNIEKEKYLIVGDSVRRDLGGAVAAETDCILVGGAIDPRAVGCYSTLLAFCNAVSENRTVKL